MKNINNSFDNFELSIEEQIQNYLENSLSPSEEEELFRRFLNQSEYRSSLRDSKLLNELIETDSDSIVLPTYLKSRILESVGLPESSNISKPFFVNSHFFKSAAKYIAVAILVALSTLLFVQNNNSIKESPFENTTNNSNLLLNNSRNNSFDKPNNYNIPYLSNNNKKAVYGKNVSFSLKPDEDKSFQDENFQLVERKSDSYRSFLSSSDIASSDKYYFNNKNNIKQFSPNLEKIENYLSNYANFLNIPIIVSIRGMSSKSFPASRISSGENPNYKNMVFGLGTYLGNHSFGFEFGDEEFNQIFNGSDSIGNYHITQNPNLYSLSVYYQYNFPSLVNFANIYPIFKISAGISEKAVAEINKGILGLEYQADSKVSFFLTLEGTAAFYQSQNKIYLSKKLGLGYGFKIAY